MTDNVLVPIVEGQSEVESVPCLLRRLLHSMDVHQVEIAKPFRVKRDRVVKEKELEPTIETAIRNRPGCAGILVLVDADDDCPRNLGPQLLRRAQAVTDLPVSVVLARSELESWFLGAKESLRGVRGIREDAAAPNNPEEIRGAKKRLTENMRGKRSYLEVEDQPAFAEAFDIGMARSRCPSLDKLVREVAFLAGQIA